MKYQRSVIDGVSDEVHGSYEPRVDWGPGYRVYYALAGREYVLLLCGGDKRKQASDIVRALEYLQDYKERSGTS